MIGDTTELAVCADCLLYIANGEVPQDESPWKPEHLERMWEGYQLVPGGPHETEEGSLGFSWRACDGCGSKLGGDRYAATAWKDDHVTPLA